METLREVQRYLVEQTRLGIPALVHNEGLAGAQLPGATAFPQSFGAAASWDPELLRQAAGVVREQLLCFGIQAVHSPLFDLARDPRWGRVGETYGEDPYLTAQMGCAYVEGAQEGGIEAAVEAAKQADVVVAVVGGKESMRAPDATCGENKDNTNIDLEPVQMELMAALVATNKPIITVILEGRALSAPAVQAGSAAVLYGYLPGQEGAKAIVRTLTGENNPAGRLPMTVPKHTGQIPLYYSKLPVYTEEDQWGEYLFPEDNAPLYAFGHGLNYTTFEYRSLSADATVPTDGVVHASFRVKNTGERDGDEVVQIYVGHKLSSAVHFLRQLVGFRRVHLAAGKERELRFAMDLRQLAYHNIDMEQVVEPGAIRLEVGASSQDIRLRTAVEITGPVRPVARKVFHSTLEVY